MAIRRSETTVTFRYPFTMPSVDGRQPAGTYRIVTDDDEVAVTPFAITTRVAMHLHTPALSMKAAVGNVFTITATELAIALDEDQQRESASRLHEWETKP
jgi:hypothetical protein